MVESVRRALRLLEELNKAGESSVHQLHLATRLPKSTIVRLLATLVDTGYVSRTCFQHGYNLTSRVQSLSAGYHGSPRLTELGRKLAIEFTHAHSWPVAMAFLEKDSMVVRFTTASTSPIAPTHGALNKRLSLLTGALGRAYLAFCPPKERELILEMLHYPKSAKDETARERHAIISMLAAIRRTGFAERTPNDERRFFSTLAVPIVDEERVVATIAMSYFSSAVSRTRLIGEYVPLVQKLALDIGRSIVAERETTPVELSRRPTIAQAGQNPSRLDMAAITPAAPTAQPVVVEPK